MAEIKVTAPEGVRLKVRVQKMEDHPRTVPEVRNSAGELLAPGKVESFKGWADSQIDTFASETRAYEVTATQRVVVEDDSAQPAG